MSDDKSKMVDILRAIGTGSDPYGIGDSSMDIVTPTPQMPGTFRPGDIDPISGLRIEESIGGSDDLPAYMVENLQMSEAKRVPIISEQQQDMKRFLELFQETGGDTLSDGVDRVGNALMEDSMSMPELSRAMTTERTSRGVRVGGWQIIAEGKTSKKYHVESVHSGQQIAKNLYLYEAAEALVNYLNNGTMINNLKIQNILSLEMEYAKHVEDAIQYKHACSRAIDRGDDHKLEISKIRFNEAKVKAVAAKQKLVEHLK